MLTDQAKLAFVAEFSALGSSKRHVGFESDFNGTLLLTIIFVSEMLIGRLDVIF